MSDAINPPSGFEPPQGPPISDDDADAILGGSSRPGHEDLAQVIADLRSVPQPPVGVGPELGEFVATPPTRPPYIDELPPVPPPAPTGRRPVLARPLARMALAAGIGIVGVSGAHAAGVVDVPGLPDRGDGTEVVFVDDEGETAPAGIAADDAEESESPAADAAGTDNGSLLEDPVEATVTYGDLSVSISIGSADGESFSIEIDVEGVSPECEAALESLSGTYTSEDAAEAAAADAQAACEGDFDLVFPDLDDPAAFEAFLDEFEFSLDLPDDFGRFFDEEFGGLGDFDLGELEQLLEDFDFDRLEEYFGQHGQGGFFFDLDELPEGFDPGELEGFFENFDPEELQGFFEELPFDPEQFEGLFENFDPEELQGFFEELPFDLDGFEGLDPESFGKFFDELDPESFEGFFDELPFDFDGFEGEPGDFFDDFFDQGTAEEEIGDA